MLFYTAVVIVAVFIFMEQISKCKALDNKDTLYDILTDNGLIHIDNIVVT